MKKITIQPRDKSVSYPPRGFAKASDDQVMKAFVHGLERYKKVMSELAKV
ncbi:MULTISPECIES: hypothetical protein [Serratia]|nr:MULTISPECIES: hypothetical protein [Serratia]MBI6154150.1 hypothetical protein [Serratia surfactantfaciens]BEM00836.1 hypothetical protein SM14VA2_32480 [Serratia marcescens]